MMIANSNLHSVLLTNADGSDVFKAEIKLQNNIVAIDANYTVTPTIKDNWLSLDIGVYFTKFMSYGAAMYTCFQCRDIQKLLFRTRSVSVDIGRIPEVLFDLLSVSPALESKPLLLPIVPHAIKELSGLTASSILRREDVRLQICRLAYPSLLSESSKHASKRF